REGRRQQGRDPGHHPAHGDRLRALARARRAEGPPGGAAHRLCGGDEGSRIPQGGGEDPDGHPPAERRRSRGAGQAGYQAAEGGARPHRANPEMEMSAAELVYCTLMLAARITLPHFSVSSAISFPKSAGESASTVPPRSASRAFSLGSASAVLISLL